MFWLLRFSFPLLSMSSFVYRYLAGENKHLMCVRDLSFDYLEEIKIIHSVIRQKECWAIIQEIWLVNVQNSNSLDIPFSVKSCSTLGDVKKILSVSGIQPAFIYSAAEACDQWKAPQRSADSGYTHRSRPCILLLSKRYAADTAGVPELEPERSPAGARRHGSRYISLLLVLYIAFQ